MSRITVELNENELETLLLEAFKRHYPNFDPKYGDISFHHTKGCTPAERDYFSAEITFPITFPLNKEEK